MEGVGFSQKWGIAPEEVATSLDTPSQRSMWTVVLGQFVVLVLVLCIVRPSFALDVDSALKIPEVSAIRVVVVAALVVALTYFYPQLVSSF